MLPSEKLVNGILPHRCPGCSSGYAGLGTTYGPTQMHRETVETGRAELAVLKQELESFVNTTLPGLKTALMATDAPPIHE